MRAIGTTMAVIEFSPQGEILSANDAFLSAFGYSEKEIEGCHHGIFVADLERRSAEYRQFWASLATGTFCRGQFTRYAKDGQSVELEACYQPILDENGKVVKVIKFAYDVTAQKQRVLAELQARADQIDQAKLEVAQEVERRLKLDALLDEVSIPITPVWDQLLLVPLVGFIDTSRSEKIMDRVLADIVANRARELIVDISGVPLVDTDTASRLVSIARAASLMGCHSTISGISPQIAKTMTSLGIDLEGMSTTGTLMDAISGAYERLDFAVSKRSSLSPQNSANQ
jgi:PAS domain S-box-containing protein